MRKITFRGKCIDNSREFNGKWMIGDLVHSGGKTYIHPQGNKVSAEKGLGHIIIMHEVDPDTVDIVHDKDESIKLGDRVYVMFIDSDRVRGASTIAYVDGVFVTEDDLYYYIEGSNSHQTFPFRKDRYTLRKC